MADGKGLYKADSSVSSGGFLAFTSKVVGGYCSASDVTKCGSKKVKTFFSYSWEDAAKTRSAWAPFNVFKVTGMVTNPEKMTALRGRGEYDGGSWSNDKSLLNDYFLTVTTKAATFLVA